MNRFSIHLSGDQLLEVNEAAIEAGMNIPDWLGHIVELRLSERRVECEKGSFNLTPDEKNKLLDATKTITELLQVAPDDDRITTVNLQPEIRTGKAVRAGIPAGFYEKQDVMRVIWSDAKVRPSIQTWNHWEACGIIPSVRIGERVFYKVSDVRQSLEDQIRATNLDHQFNAGAGELITFGR